MRPRVVLDTNVLVSGLLGGAATDVIRRWRAGDVQMVLSPDVMAEYEDVLNRPKFRLPRWVVQVQIAQDENRRPQMTAPS